MKYFILIMVSCVFCSCATIKKYRSSGEKITLPEKAERENRFIRSIVGGEATEKQVLTPQSFTKLTLSTGAFSFLLFQFLKWKHIV